MTSTLKAEVQEFNMKQAPSSWSVVKTLQTCAYFKYKPQTLFDPVEKDACKRQRKTEGTQEGSRQQTGLVHGLGQREQTLWRKEGSVRCGTPHTDLCVTPEQLSLHRGPSAVLLTVPGVAARDPLAAQASHW